MIRVHAQARSTDESRRYRLRDLARALDHPWTLAAGEVTRWPEVWGGQTDLLARIDLALRRGQRVEGHTAGGSMPAFIRDHGFVDHLIRVALERGIPPVDAYRMATLNPATYLGREA